MKKIAIVILNFNGTKDTIECLESINKLSAADIAFSVIIDNGSKEKFKVESSKLKVGDINIIRSEENLGFAGGNNIGIKYALKNGADYIFILNNDTILDKNLIKELLVVMESDEKIGVVVPKIYFAKGYEFHKDRYEKDQLGKIFWYTGGIMDWKNVIGFHRGVDQVDSGQFDEITETEYATGCAMFVKKEVFERVGFFNEKYYLYYEDADFSERVKSAGYKIIYAPKAILWHKNAGSGGGSGSKLQDYYITRNRLFFGVKYAPLRSKLALIKESLKLLVKGRDWQKKGVMDFYRNKLEKGSCKNKF